MQDKLIAEAEQVRVRYETLWELLHAEPVFGFTDRYRVEGTIRRLNDLGFAVDEISLQPVSDDPSRLKVHVAVGDRRYHAQRLRELTGLDVGEGQARILLGDLRAYQAQLCQEAGHDVDESTAARLWVIEVVTPYERVAHDVGGAKAVPRSRRTAICSKSGGCSASRPATTSARTKPLRRWPATSSRPTRPPRWRSPRCRQRRCPS